MATARGDGSYGRRTSAVGEVDPLEERSEGGLLEHVGPEREYDGAEPQLLLWRSAKVHHHDRLFDGGPVLGALQRLLELGLLELPDQVRPAHHERDRRPRREVRVRDVRCAVHAAVCRVELQVDAEQHGADALEDVAQHEVREHTLGPAEHVHECVERVDEAALRLVKVNVVRAGVDRRPPVLVEPIRPVRLKGNAAACLEDGHEHEKHAPARHHEPEREFLLLGHWWHLGTDELRVEDLLRVIFVVLHLEIAVALVRGDLCIVPNRLSLTAHLHVDAHSELRKSRLDVDLHLAAERGQDQQLVVIFLREFVKVCLRRAHPPRAPRQQLRVVLDLRTRAVVHRRAEPL